MRRNHLIGNIITAALLCGSVAGHAEETAVAIVAVNESVTRALAAFQQRAGDDDPAWFVPPYRQRKVVGQKTVEVRYTKKIVEEPVYEYETVEVYRNVREGDSMAATTVREKVQVRRPVKQIGTRPVERLVRDPNGSEIKQEKRPIYEPGGPDLWRHGNIGLNGLILHALIQAGVDPNDAAVKSVTAGLQALVNNHGLPDATWDLAGLVAGLSAVTDPLARQIAQDAAGKLLDGQIETGPAAGLWGPVAIHLKMYALGVEERTRLSNLYAQARAEHAKTMSKAAEKKMDELQSALQSLDEELKRIAQCSQQTVKGAVITIEGAGGGDAIAVVPPPHYVWNQTSADLESTAIAVFALRVAAENRNLPKQSWRPTGLLWQRLGPALPPDAVLTRTLRAVSAAQQPDGRWSELNLHQPVTEFARVPGIEGVPPKPASFVALPSPVTPVSTAQGYACLVNLGRMLRALDQLAPRYRAAEKALAGPVGQLRAGNLKDCGGLVPPYELLFWLRDLPAGGDETAAWCDALREWLVNEQADDGFWRAGNRPVRLLPTSVRERIQVLPVAPTAGQKGVPFDLAQAHVLFNAEKRFANMINTRYSYEPTMLPTAYALSYLAAQSAPATPPK